MGDNGNKKVFNVSIDLVKDALELDKSNTGSDITAGEGIG